MEFVILDIETRIDKQLLSRVFFGKGGLTEDEAYLRFREDLLSRGSDFFPMTLHLPISIAIGAVDSDYVLHSVECLAAGGGSEVLAREFWRRMESFAGCLVTFNGRRFDLPVLELAALRWGIAAPRYFRPGSGRASGSSEHHLDLCEYLTNFGETGLRGGMDLLLKMIGLPGKLTMNGAMVQEYFDAGRVEEIDRYCRDDVIQTYFLFLRVKLMRGAIDAKTYEAASSASAHFLQQLNGGRAA
jgi:predicted PolB exonuclease-like 3'-5' exonuclease